VDDISKSRITESLKSEYFNEDLYRFDDAYRKRNSDANYSKLINFLRQSKQTSLFSINIDFYDFI
jgi:hypothetical protein